MNTQLRTLVTLLCTSLLVCEAALAAVPVVPKNPLFTLLRRGDAAAVHTFEHDHGAGPITRSIDHAQLHYAIPQLLSAARKCQNVTFNAGSQDALDTALWCSYIARSSALILGDAREFLQQTRWEKDVLYPALDKVNPGFHATFDGGLDHVNLKKLSGITPTVSQSWLAASKHLPSLNSERARAMHTSPIVRINIDGHPVDASVRTNDGVRTPVVLVEPAHSKTSRAARLGLTPLVRNYTHAVVRAGSVTYRTKPDLFLADTVMVGPLVMHHLAVEVIRSDFAPPGIYLGNAMWRRFGEVAVSNTGIRLSRHPVNDCAQPLPLTFAANFHEQGSLVFPVNFNGVKRTATFVANPSAFITVSAGAWGEDATSGKTGKATPKLGSVKGSATLQIGSQTIDVASVDTKVGPHKRYRLKLGTPVLDAYTIRLQLAGGSPSICFAPNSGGGRSRTP